MVNDTEAEVSQVQSVTEGRSDEHYTNLEERYRQPVRPLEEPEGRTWKEAQPDLLGNAVLVQGIRELYHRFEFGLDFYMGNWYSIDVNKMVYRREHING